MSSHTSNCITPIKFQQLAEDHQENCSRGNTKSNCELESSFSSSNSQVSLNAYTGGRDYSNFTLSHSYPTVIFDDVCLSIDRSKQQSNFLEECLFRAKQCFGSAIGLSIETKQVEILKSINLNVPHGSIFGLLGPSSCGKTTLLRCLVGLLQPTSGSIRLFGHGVSSDRNDSSAAPWFRRLFGSGNGGNSTRTSGLGVPGVNVGYMPQDLGLYEDFTIREILEMFGRYVQMSSKLVETRIEFMRQFLELPDVDRRIQTLSGGQKRRVSFAIACLHMPPLIILDEPTVGVDPLLRQSIWKYLRRLADEENKTIIITTHYIEEAAQADQVAFMRAGEILVQGAPSKIMRMNDSNTLEEAFLKICNNYENVNDTGESPKRPKSKLYPQSRFNWPEEVKNIEHPPGVLKSQYSIEQNESNSMNQLRLKAKEKMELFDILGSSSLSNDACHLRSTKFNRGSINQLPMAPTNAMISKRPQKSTNDPICDVFNSTSMSQNEHYNGKRKRSKLLKRSKFILNDSISQETQENFSQFNQQRKFSQTNDGMILDNNQSLIEYLRKNLSILFAIMYKNYRRNFNSLPLLAFQFMLPMLQMISFSLCVGGRPTNIGLGLVNGDQPISFASSDSLLDLTSGGLGSTSKDYEETIGTDELLSLRYLSFLDDSMLSVKSYDNLQDAISDVRKAKLWAVMEIGANFSTSITRRFDLENFYQLDLDTIHQSVIKLYPDQSNKILHMICHRSVTDSFRKFLADQFEHFKRLPIEMKEPIFDIKPNIISNSIDGYTESIAPGLLASLTYIMAAGLTTFIMVVERSAGLLERTYTSGINPVTYLLAHAIFRSLVMMAQIALVFVLTFYVLKQPLVGSLWLAYLMLMTLNLTGITYGLLISSIVADQNGAALTIVSSLVVKITLSGILWPLEAIPVWLRTICYIQPLTMPVQALKSIILKGSTLGDRAVNLGFLVSISWLIIFITISAKRFKFYQH